MGIQVEDDCDIEEVVASVTAYVQKIVDETDVSDLFLATTLNNQYANWIPMSQGVIGYHGKVSKPARLAQNYLYNQYSKSFYISINVNDYVEHRAEVLQSYAQNWLSVL